MGLELLEKKLLEKIPGGRTRLASYAAALYLVRENWEHKTEEQILSEDSSDFADYIRVFRLSNFKRALEEMPANAMGGGAIAGGGINGPDDVKVSKKARKRYKTDNKKEAEDYHQGLKAFVNMKFNGLK